MLGKQLKSSTTSLELVLEKLNQLEPFIALVLAFHGALLLLIGGSSLTLWIIVLAMMMVGLSSFLPERHYLNTVHFRAFGIWLLAWCMMFFHAGAASYFFFWMVVLVVTYTYYLPRFYAMGLPLFAALSVALLSLMTSNMPAPAALNKFLHLNIIGYLIFLLSLQVQKQFLELRSVTTTLKEKEAFYRHQSNHDPLTELPNRRYLMQVIQTEFAQAERQSEYQFALMFIDIDDLKQVNDALGHLAGDSLILEVVKRVKACIRSSNALARIGGDEFALVMSNLKESEDVTKVAQRIHDHFKEPWQWQEQELCLSVSIGISYSSSGNNAQKLLSQADHAMYTAKNTGKAKHVVFDAEMP